MNSSGSISSCCILYTTVGTCCFGRVTFPWQSLSPAFCFQKQHHNEHSYACPLRHPCESFSRVPVSKGVCTKCCAIAPSDCTYPLSNQPCLNVLAHIPTGIWYHPPFQCRHSAGCTVASHCRFNLCFFDHWCVQISSATCWPLGPHPLLRATSSLLSKVSSELHTLLLLIGGRSSSLIDSNPSAIVGITNVSSYSTLCGLGMWSFSLSRYR